MINDVVGASAPMHGESKREELRKKMQSKIKLASTLQGLQGAAREKSKKADTMASETGDESAAVEAEDSTDESLPPLAQQLVGTWKPIKTENYSNYLKDVVGLNVMIRKIAEKIPLTPTYTIENGMLHCIVSCPGATAVESSLVSGHSTSYEPNTKVTFECEGVWQSGPPPNFTVARSSPKVLKGAPITACNFINDKGQLVLKQSWGNSCFTTTHTRV
uniref:Uncharacterized protein n=1 Tax=Haptolina ericina TaxID=156174 RepID=A0A7S3AFC9_9EUKA